MALPSAGQATFCGLHDFSNDACDPWFCPAPFSRKDDCGDKGNGSERVAQEYYEQLPALPTTNTY